MNHSQNNIFTCTSCNLCRTRRNVVPGNGRINSNIWLIGEAPGKTEDIEGTPFCGKSGKELDRVLAGYGINRRSVWVTNLVKCRPPENRDPEPAEIEACSQWLWRDLLKQQPEYIGLVGRYSARYLLGDDLDLLMEYGLPIKLNIGYGPVTFVPLFHPAYGLISPRNMIRVMKGLESFNQVVKQGGNYTRLSDKHLNTDYRIIDKVANLEQELSSNNHSIIAIDTESADNKPWCMSFSTRPGYGRVIMAEEKELLKKFNTYINNNGTNCLIHNALWDLPILSDMGITPSKVTDTMVMAYLLGDEPQGLKALSYRHCGMGMSNYEDMVRGATKIKAIEYLSKVYFQTWDDNEPVVSYKDGEVEVKQPQNIKRRVKKIIKDTFIRGADPYERWYKIKARDGRRQVEGRIGKLQEGFLSDIPIEDAVYYSARDADATIRVYPILLERLNRYNGLVDVLQDDMNMLQMVVDMRKFGIKVDREHFKAFRDELEDDLDTINTDINNHFSRLINLKSHPQVSELLYSKAVGLGLRKPRSKTQYATGDDILSRLVHYDKSGVVAKIKNHRKLSKLADTYANIPDKAGGDDRVRADFKITRTDTGRLAASEPNLMAIPVRTPEGRRIRRGFVAQEGCYLVSLDYSQIEMRIAAHASGDSTLINAFKQGLDVHSAAASRVFEVPIDEIDEILHRRPAKTVNFGILYGMTSFGLQRALVMNGLDENYWTDEKCQDLINDWFMVYSGIRDYMTATLDHAQKYGYVQDIWGRVRIIPNANAADPILRSDALKQAGNAPIQMGAQGVIKKAMGELVPYYREFNSQGYIVRPLIQIHDDLVFEIGENVLEVVVPLIMEVMENAAPDICVPVKVDFKYGKNWENMDKKEL